jgi:hypothetical protein
MQDTRNADDLGIKKIRITGFHFRRDLQDDEAALNVLEYCLRLEDPELMRRLIYAGWAIPFDVSFDPRDPKDVEKASQMGINLTQHL